jgi:hypothetical protein
MMLCGVQGAAGASGGGGVAAACQEANSHLGLHMSSGVAGFAGVEG